MSHRFRDLVVWQRAMQFVTQIYVLTRDFPKHELFGLTSQLRRAAISVPLNIAEG
ncbi:MAG: four helix bundle protein, partial [Chloroflexota bacterium]|nr:four helix bundle protein [Chloroflexota bacterium]